MANLRCVQTLPVQPLPAEPAGDVMVQGVPAQTTGPCMCRAASPGMGTLLPKLLLSIQTGAPCC